MPCALSTKTQPDSRGTSPAMTKRGGEKNRARGARAPPQRRATISFLISAMALAGFRLFGQVRVQFMMVWQR